MKIIIKYPTPLDEIKDKLNDNIDVCITYNNKDYTIVFATIKNIIQEVIQKGFYNPGSPPIIVKELSEDLIKQAILYLIDNENLLRIYGADLI